MYGARNPRWRFLLLDGEDRQIGALDGVNGGYGSAGALTQLGGSASVSIDKREGQDIDPLRDRLQAVYDPGIDGVEAWPVGTYLFSSPTEHHTTHGVTYEYGLQTKMLIPEADRIPARFSLAPGAQIIPAMVDLIHSTGETRVAVTPSDAVLPGGRTWEAGTPKREIINDLAQTAGYWSLWADGSGLYRVEPWVDPTRRPVTFSFRHGRDSLHYSDWKRTRNDSGVPNRVIVRGQERQDEDPIEAVAENRNPDSPYSFESRGRWISADPYEGGDYADQAAAQAYADARLLELMDPVSRLEAVTAMIPLEPNDLLEFIPEDGERRLVTAQKFDFNFEPFTDLSHEWREVLPV